MIVVAFVVVVAKDVVEVEVTVEEVLVHSGSGQMQVQSGTEAGLAFGQGPALRMGQSRTISFRSVSTVTYFLSAGVHWPAKRHCSIVA